MKLNTGRLDAAACIIAAAIASGIAVLLFQLWHFQWSVPLVPSGDTLQTGINIRSTIETGWFLTNNRLAAPGAYQYYDFTISEGFNFLVIKLIALFTSDWAVVGNVFYLISYPLTAITATFVARRLDVSAGLAVALGVLYAFLPYHWMAVEHVYLSSALWVVPLGVLAIVWLFSDDPPFFRADAQGRLRFDPSSPRSIAALLIGVLLGSTGIYFAYFAVILALAAGAIGGVRRRRPVFLVSALPFVGAVCLSGLVNLAPSFVYWAQHGMNAAAVMRWPAEIDLFGLRITSMLRPVFGHRVPIAAETPQWYGDETAWARLGIVGSIGFIWLTLVALARPPLDWLSARSRLVMSGIATLTVFGLLIATVGGFAMSVSLVWHPVRAYTRISTFIAMFCLIGVALCAQAALDRVRTRRWRTGAWLLVVLLVSLAIVDQTPPTLATGADAVARVTYERAFVSKVEATLGKGATVFQLPYVAYMEGSPVGRIADPYDPAIGYLYSDTLRWSYGSMKGRETAAWQERVASLPPAQMVAELSASGFNAIWVDRFGYADDAATLEAGLARVVGPARLVDDKGRWAVYAIAAAQ
jgi:phosphoglycerol transferase